ncbi:MAG: threonylcarbamoyl-AMP synthase, partial [Clostridia bacterium]|nr:threonylcarbamoyl-AMP synthase [Clostridia bacterium]
MNTLYFERATVEALEACGSLIRQGKLVAFPTETVYGLGADATNTEAVEAIYEAKGRESDNPLIVHFADAADIAKYAEIPDPALFDLLVTAFVPGPLTLVLPRKEALSARVSAGLSTVAVRVPSHETARAFLRAAARPVAAPSANRSHRPSPTTSAHVLTDLDGKISAVLEGGASEHGVESTVLFVGEQLRLLRPGAVTREMIEAVTGREVLVDSGVLSRVEDVRRVSSPGMKYRHYA